MARWRRERLAGLGIDPALGTLEGPSSAGDLLRRVGALQAQDYGSGAWSVGLRTGLTAAEVEQAVVAREIVRTWPMRGTLHWVAAEDARWMCELLAGKVLGSVGRRFDELGLTETDVKRSREVLEEHLTEPRSRPDVVDLLAAHGIDPAGQRAYHLVGYHCMTGLLCQGPLIGRQPSFVLLDAWVPFSRKPAREEGLAIIADRYLRSHGPVTERDLAGWVSHGLGLAREALALLGDRVERHEVDGEVWLRHAEAAGAAVEAEGLAPRAGGSPDAPAPSSPRVHLLPQWDEFLLGYKTRDVVLPPEHVVKVVPGRNMVFRPTVVVDGEVAGVWRRTTAGRRAAVEVELFRGRATARLRRALEASTAAYGRFLGQETDLRVGGS
ncbi:MAG: winged helix DNA-binding domain-containing protein [Intrasporangium sp.]|uniref:winged helix DNA-binding domain-containing protein n=1 Tax=Intrasporangium sp. TaxID=1925024 RepID=UPI003F7EB624